jgi:hypothetical protein
MTVDMAPAVVSPGRIGFTPIQYAICLKGIVWR